MDQGYGVERSLWFVTGSQHLYGEQVLGEVAAHARTIAAELSACPEIPLEVNYSGVVTADEEILRVCRAANADDACAGIILWMHTFSPAKMWIAGLQELNKPLLHFHTQYNRDIPWDTIDMDFMNLNQSAHGDREFGFMVTRLGKRREAAAGHWQNPAVRRRIGSWSRSAVGHAEARVLKVARFGDNMRNVAVTEGDKVAAQQRFGFRVDGYGIGDLAAELQGISSLPIDALIEEYAELYHVGQELLPGGSRHEALREEARMELALRSFLSSGKYAAFTTTFEDLHGLNRLPGFAVQRLMAAGYGFGAEGDWKTAALTRIAKVMGEGLPGGSSFMEDYTYHFTDDGRGLVLGAHMLEVCPTIAAERPRLEISPLGIGGKADPIRLIFTAGSGPAVNATLIDLGDRFRLVLNELETVAPESDLPNLPVARALWKPFPDLCTAAEAWIYAGGAHHSVYSQTLSVEQFAMLADIWGIEAVVIDRTTASLREFRRGLLLGDIIYRLHPNFV